MNVNSFSGMPFDACSNGMILGHEYCAFETSKQALRTHLKEFLRNLVRGGDGVEFI